MDANNEPYSEHYDVNLNLYSQALLGISAGNSLVILILILVIIAAVIFLVFRRRKNKR